MSTSPDAKDNPPAEVQQEADNGLEKVKKDEKEEKEAAIVQPPGNSTRTQFYC